MNMLTALYDHRFSRVYDITPFVADAVFGHDEGSDCSRTFVVPLSTLWLYIANAQLVQQASFTIWHSSFLCISLFPSILISRTM